MKGNGNNGAGRLAAAAIRCQPDSRLVGLVREGHDLAFEEIVRRYRQQLVGFAGAIVPRDHAEDIVQEALAKAHGALERGDSEINLRPWLYTIVRNRALNALRDEPVYDRLDENFDGVPQPPEVAARQEELTLLIAGLRGLPAPQKQAIVGRELEGRSHEEIATSLGTTPGAVRGLIYRARAKLREGLGLLVPLPLLRAMLGAGPAGSEAAGAGGAAAAGLAAGGGGVALKTGATLGVAVIAVGSGIAVQHRGSTSDDGPAASVHGAPEAAAHSSRSAQARVSSARLVADTHGGRRGPGSDDSVDRGEGHGPSSSSGPGGADQGGSSGEGSSGSGDGGHSGPGGGGDDGGSSGTSGSGSSGSGDDGSGGSGTSGSGGGDDGGGSGTSGSGGGETSTSDGAGDSSGPGGGGGETTTTTTTGDDGGEGSG